MISNLAYVSEIELGCHAETMTYLKGGFGFSLLTSKREIYTVYYPILLAFVPKVNNVFLQLACFCANFS